jgi:serine/threonine protein kinase
MSDLHAEPPDALLGQVFDDRYRLDRVLGAGGMGKVYQATNLNTEKTYALKVMLAEHLDKEDAHKRFAREARAISAINHPHIVELYDFGQTPAGAPYLVMEYLEGTTLRACLKESSDSGLPLNQVLCVGMQITQALAHIHQRGIVHRDIKPENIQLVPHEEQPIFSKLLDFGIARIQNQEAVTQLNRGTPASWAYAAPEMLRGTQDPTPAVDIYALGIVLYEIITGSRPFTGEDMEVVWAHLQSIPPRLSQAKLKVRIPTDLDTLVAQMLEKDPTRRPTPAEAHQRLEVLSAQLPTASDARIHSLRTYVLPGKPEESKAAPAPAKPEQGEPRNLVQLLKMAREVDQIESERERVCAQLDEECQRIIQESWLGKVPTEISELMKRGAQIQDSVLNIEMDLAVLRDTLADERAALQGQRDQLRQQLQAVRDKLRAVPLTQRSAERASAHELIRLERVYAAPIPHSPTAQRIQQEGMRRQQLRDELLASQRKVAEQILQAVLKAGKGKTVDRTGLAVARRVQRISKALSQLASLNEALRKY